MHGCIWNLTRCSPCWPINCPFHCGDPAMRTMFTAHRWCRRTGNLETRKGSLLLVVRVRIGSQWWIFITWSRDDTETIKHRQPPYRGCCSRSYSQSTSFNTALYFLGQYLSHWSRKTDFSGTRHGKYSMRYSPEPWADVDQWKATRAIAWCDVTDSHHFTTRPESVCKLSGCGTLARDLT